jgi:thiosulfate reductase cytochrome b subunit
MDEVACETCHIPQVYAPAAQSYDWTVLRLSAAAQTACRGVASTGGDAAATAGGGVDTVNDLVSGYEPVLLQRTGGDGQELLAPYNLISAWYWTYDDASGNTRPVRQLDLEAAYLKGGKYAPEVLSAFDGNEDGALDASELKIDNEAKQALIAARLTALGLGNVRIQAQTLPFSINHGVARGEYAINDCETCHTRDSRIAQPLKLADSVPGGVLPQFAEGSNVSATGEMFQDASGALYYQPVASNDELYVFGSSSVTWVDRFGALFFVAVLAGVAGHGTMRYVASPAPRGREPAGVKTDKVYLYGVRALLALAQTVLIILCSTGLIIHRPDIFGLFAFRNMVLVHNILAAILVINAALSLFYHLTTGHIRQFIPRPYGFFDQAIVQAKYYMGGIFKGDPHPFDKTPDRKMNPLQQVTYFGILMVLLPLQTLTGLLMWGVQRWPQIAETLGGLTFLAPLHTLLAWLFGAFIVGHVYLITTGTTPLESMRGMVTGWEDVETHEPAHGD